MRYYLFTLVFLSTINSCSQDKKNLDTQILDSLGIKCIRIDSLVVNDDLLRYSYFNKNKANIEPDSIKFFYRKNRNLQAIFYQNDYPMGVTSKSYYSNGNIEEIVYDSEYVRKGDTLSISYYENGNVMDLKICKQDSILYPITYISYHLNGQQKDIGDYDMYIANIVPRGIWHNYDSMGHLQKNTFYYLAEPNKAYITVQLYDMKGNIKSEKIYNNYVLYEDEPKELEIIP